MQRGQSIAEEYRRDTSSKASLQSSHLKETVRNFHSMSETRHTKSIERILKKDAEINTKIKKRNDQFRKTSSSIRDRLSLRFERNKSARSMVSDEDHRKIKLAEQRLHQKDRLKEIL
jgi:hypothetical protein